MIGILKDIKDTMLISVYEKGEHHGISWNILRRGMFSSRAHKITFRLSQHIGGATQGGNLKVQYWLLSKSLYLTIILKFKINKDSVLICP